MSAGCGPSWTSSVTGERFEPIHAVDGTGPDDVWAVGSSEPLDSAGEIRHWDGSSWTGVRRYAETSHFFDVAAIARDDAWVVGFHQWHNSHEEGPIEPLALHWNGAGWNRTSPPRIAGELHAVDAAGPDDVWALGNQVVHRDAAGWHVVPTPAIGSLDDVEAIGPDDAWIVGWSGTLDERVPVAMHWDGTEWDTAEVPFPRVGASAYLNAVTATSPDDIWAVGATLHSRRLLPIATHWDGVRWSRPGVLFSLAGRELFDVSAFTSNDVWAVGSGREGAPASIVHWDGRSWQSIEAPRAVDDFDTSSIFSSLYSVLALRDGSVWAAGSRSVVDRLCPVRVDGPAQHPARVRAAPGAPVYWTLGAEDGSSHRIIDASGLRLFDSGMLPTGTPFSFAYPGAGTFEVEDEATGAGGSIEIAPDVFPETVDAQTPISVTAGTGMLSSRGLRVEIRVWVPGSTSPRDVPDVSTQGTARFVPRNGPGRYVFRARTVDPATHLASAWSPPVSAWLRATPPCTPTWTRLLSFDPHTASAELHGVTAFSADDLWAVGAIHIPGDVQPLIEHWNGVGWRVVPSPAQSFGILEAVAGSGPDDIWAVGGDSGPIVEHWDGSTWSRVNAPGRGGLVSVDVRAPDDVWAFGGEYGYGPLILHWDGTRWQIVYGIHRQFASLTAGTTAGPTDVWVVGDDYPDQLIGHWDGDRWTRVSAPDIEYSAQLNAVAAPGPRDVWMAGIGPDYEPLFEHWGGIHWRVAPAPNWEPRYGSVTITALSFRASDDGWAVGMGENLNRVSPVIAHWDGKAWHKVAPAQATGHESLTGVAAVSGAPTIAVGTRVVGPRLKTVTERRCP